MNRFHPRSYNLNGNRDYGFLPKRAPNLVDGAQLPAKFEPFPSDLLGKPIEELDQYVYEKVRQESLQGGPSGRGLEDNLLLTSK